MGSKLVSVVLLALYAAVTVATSQGDVPNFPTHNYSVSSNCSNASFTSGQISVTQGYISSPSGIDFRALGFPNETLSIGDSTSGELAPALTRTCAHNLDTSVINTTVSVYTCVDNGALSCTINLTHLD
jgi:hypothetical protein